MRSGELKFERLDRGLSVRQAARVLDITYQHLTKLENGKVPISQNRANSIFNRYRVHDREREQLWLMAK